MTMMMMLYVCAPPGAFQTDPPILRVPELIHVFLNHADARTSMAASGYGEHAHDMRQRTSHDGRAAARAEPPQPW
eukprot:scaffold2017_cov387-Prasinococcus_capsulatus_cf.AAC.12